MRVRGNTVLITGGATGIGLALARALADLDNEVIICGRRREMLKEAKSDVPGLHTKMCDVSRGSSRTALVRWVTGRFKSLNILVNNAGVQCSVDFTKGPRDLEEAAKEVATNLMGPLELSAMLIPHLRRRKESAIVNITSGLAFAPLAAVPVYCATKAALHSLSMSMRHQLQGTSIRLFEVAPPMVATDLGGGRGRRAAGAWCMSAEEAASGVIEALAHDRFEVALGGAVHLRKKRDAAFEDMNG
ncbi:MAG: SDR family NAD(P)-dependent oxidoreductase [Candidatus Eisenbacteria bacterium]